jgi:hypothetical protein
MRRSRKQALGVLLTLSVLVGAAGLGVGQAAAQAAPTWTLRDVHQPACAAPGNPTDTLVRSYGVDLRGRWTNPNTVGLDQAPPGATTWSLTYSSATGT